MPDPISFPSPIEWVEVETNTANFHTFHLHFIVYKYYPKIKKFFVLHWVAELRLICSPSRCRQASRLLGINHGCIICKRWTKWGKKNKIKQNPLQIVDIVSSTKFGLILFRSPVSNGESAANINPILQINFSFFRKCRFNWKKCKIS